MKSICFFCSYYAASTMPYYVKFYLQELKRHFTKVILVTNEKEMTAGDISFLKSIDIDINLVVNEGYDFGMYYKMFQKYDVSEYERVGLINDSCILFNKLNSFFIWLDKEGRGYYGLTDSYEFSFHLQSYFLIVNKEAIPLVKDYFNKNGIVKDLLTLVMVYEVGLSTYLLNLGISVKAFYPTEVNRICNPTYLDAMKLIKKDFPLIKKKILLQEYPLGDWKPLVMSGFDPYPKHYIRAIKRVMRNSYQSELFLGYIKQKNKGKPWAEFLFARNYLRVKWFGLLVVVVRKIKRTLGISRRKNIVP